MGDLTNGMLFISNFTSGILFASDFTGGIHFFFNITTSKLKMSRSCLKFLGNRVSILFKLNTHLRFHGRNTTSDFTRGIFFTSDFTKLEAGTDRRFFDFIRCITD